MQVDIVVPTYKRGELLRESLESIRQQTWSDWRCWVCDDDEQGGAAESIGDFLADQRFQYVAGNHCGAPAGPRNRGMKKGQGELIAFLDDDDTWLPEKLERQVGFFLEHPGCVLLGTNGYRWDPREEFDKNRTPPYFLKSRYWDRPVPYGAMFETNHFIVSSVMIRREVVGRSGMFNQRLKVAEDYELWLRVASLGEAWNLREPLIIFRDTPPTYYKRLDKQDDYRLKAEVLELALK